ncbi:transposase [Cryobacterium sp. N19]|uniref:transposase n=1 Tax=Cryobacterium sp. N19 TaxID=2048288 RepID=UPI0035175E6B
MAGTRRADHAAPPVGGTRQRTVASPEWCNFRGLIRWIINVVYSLKLRGLDGVNLVISDAHSGLNKAISTVFGVPVLSGPGAHISNRPRQRFALNIGPLMT